MKNKNVLKLLAEYISWLDDPGQPEKIDKETYKQYLQEILDVFQGIVDAKKSKHFNLPQRLVDEFGWEACKDIAKYFSGNATSTIHPGDVDVVVGGYEKWLKDNNFQIIDLTYLNTK